MDDAKAQGVRRALKAIHEDVLRYSLDVDRMYEHGIAGMKKTVRNPEYDTGMNAEGNEFLGDFPSFYQVDGVEFILRMKRALIADEQGVGKTAQGVATKLEIENRYGGKVKTLVITPNQVKGYWDEKIGEYTERKQKVVGLDSYDDDSLDRIDDADFTIMNFDIFGNKQHRGHVTERLLRERFRYVILDEVHNTKNPEAKRSDNIRWLANQAEYLGLLSGTPLPDSLNDVYMLIALLESDIYKDIVRTNGRVVNDSVIRGIWPRHGLLVGSSGNIIGESMYYVTEGGNIIASDNSGILREAEIVRTAPDVVRDNYWKQPTLIRAVLGRRKLRREMEDVRKLPPIHIYPEGLKGKLKLSPNQLAIYNAIYENDDLDGAYKLQQLRKALTDPSIVNPLLLPEGLRDLAQHTDSVKYTALDEIIKEKVAKGGKVAVFSPIFKTGVIKKLEKRYKSYGALRIDGDISSSEREEIRHAFQKDPDKKVLLATSVISMGIPLTAASTEVLIDDPYSPGSKSQMIKRVHRPGQKNDVDVISLAVGDTVDDGMLELLYIKQEGIDFLERGQKLRPEHIDAMGDKPSSSRPLRDREYTPQQKIRIYSSRMVGMGSKRIEGALKRHDFAIAKKYAECYRDGWEQSYSANVARGVKQVVDALSSRIGLKDKIDIGSAFGVLGEILGEEITNVELNPYHFRGRESERNIVAPMHRIPLADGLFDLAVCSLALYYTSIDKKAEKMGVMEREKAMREANRLLKDKGYYILTMPKTVITSEQDMIFRGNFAAMGFEVAPELTGYVQIGDTPRTQTYFATMRKLGQPQEAPLPTAALTLEVDDRTAGKERKTYSGTKGVFNEFVFINPDGGDESIMGRAESYLRRLYGDDV